MSVRDIPAISYGMLSLHSLSSYLHQLLDLPQLRLQGLQRCANGTCQDLLSRLLPLLLGALRVGLQLQGPKTHSASALQHRRS